MTHTSGQRPAAQSNQDGVERRHGLHQFQADGRRTLAGLDVEAVFDQPDAVVARDGHRPLAGHVEVDLHQLQPGVQCADAIKLDRRSKAGCDDGDIDSPGATGPSEPVSERRLATTSAPRALKLRTGFAVSSLMLTAQPSSDSIDSQRYNGVSRKIASITPRAARIRPKSRRVSCITQQRSDRRCLSSWVNPAARRMFADSSGSRP